MNELMKKPEGSDWERIESLCYHDYAITGEKIISRFYNQGQWHENYIPKELKDWKPDESTRYNIWWRSTDPADPEAESNDILVYIEEAYKEVDPCIYLYAESNETDGDWYGDFTYYGNPLEKYTFKSDLWITHLDLGSGRGTGYKAAAVKTTLNALEYLGWKDDYEKYKSSKEIFEKLK